jgi:hypothetical protein
MTVRILAIIAWIVIGCVAGVVVVGELGQLSGVRQQEGNLAYFAVTFGAPLGIAAGVLFAIWMLRRFKDSETRQKRFVGFSFLGIIAVVIGGVAFEKIRTRDDIHVGIGIQVRFPPGMTPPTERATIKAELRTPNGAVKSNNYYGAEIDPGNGRPYVYDSYDLYRAVPKRVVALRIGDGPTYLFTLRIEPRPKKQYVNFSDWYPVDEIDDNSPGKAPRAPLPGERLEIRHTVSGGE